jgi:hypothetical protein
VCTACPVGSTSQAGASTCQCSPGFGLAGSGVTLTCTRTPVPVAYKESRSLIGVVAWFDQRVHRAPTAPRAFPACVRLLSLSLCARCAERQALIAACGVWGTAACTAGSFSGPEASVCLACPPFSTSAGAAGTCVCNPGFGTTGSGSTLLCTGASRVPVGGGRTVTDDAWLPACAPGTYSFDGVSCTPCPFGATSTAGAVACFCLGGFASAGAGPSVNCTRMFMGVSCALMAPLTQGPLLQDAWRARPPPLVPLSARVRRPRPGLRLGCVTDARGYGLMRTAACLPGAFSTDGAAACTTCPAGSSSAPGAATCTCAAGYATSGASASLACLRTLCA